ncbi:DUF1971 domain-containing protein [Nisaea sp.]|uniref:DUF1971 domain-containing protein n=1 Tax=Nisaea sp. TaxID=2024842 RepID=UPI003B52FE57
MSAPAPMPPALPAGARHYSSSPHFTEITTPAKLTELHRTKPGVWGRLVVDQGTLIFVEPDPWGTEQRVGAGETVIIVPERPHRVALDGPVRFLIEFYRE